METDAGIWIDHEKAFVVRVRNGHRQPLLHPVGSRGTRAVERRLVLQTPYGPQEKSPEQKHDNRRKHNLQDYCQSVIKMVGDCRAVVIIGPGEARLELAKEMKRTKAPAARIEAVEKADKMTENQMKALFSERFSR